MNVAKVEQNTSVSYLYTAKPRNKAHGLLFILELLDRLLFKMAGFFLMITSANLRCGFLFKMNAANIGIDEYTTINKTTTQIFQPRNMLQFRIILKINTNLNYSLSSVKRSPRGGGGGLRGSYFRDGSDCSSKARFPFKLKYVFSVDLLGDKLNAEHQQSPRSVTAIVKARDFLSEDVSVRKLNVKSAFSTLATIAQHFFQQS